MSVAPSECLVVVVDDHTKVGEARRKISALAQLWGFCETDQGKVALLATEVSTNLLKHGGGGELIVQRVRDGPVGTSLDLLALDSGGGMSDVGRCLADGYSTAGSPGNGLGAIRRLADSFEIHSQSGTGTILWCRLQSVRHHTSEDAPHLEVGAVSLPFPGELVSGDAWAISERDGFTFVMVVDGLGHGPPAAHAAAEATTVFHTETALEPADIMWAAHSALQGTRGAALSIARLDASRGEIRYVGIGNISGVVLDSRTGETKSMVSQNGTVGHTIRKIQAYDYPWREESVLLMHSDGLSTHWSFDRYPGLSRRHPSLIAGALYRDHRRGRDDVTVLVARRGRTE